MINYFNIKSNEKINQKIKIKMLELLSKIEQIYSENDERWRFKKENYKYGQLKILRFLSREREFLTKEIEEYKSLISTTNIDSEKEIIENEITKTKEKEELVIERAKKIILEEEGIKDNCVIEIRPGAGGVEAGLFVRDLYQMYYRFSIKKNWKVEIIESKSDSIGNFSFISFLVKGKSAFQFLRNESGVHRVQRVPITESKGRLQTSTASIVVLPEVNDITIRIEDKDLRIDKYKSGGAGGQHVNTTDSAVRITHIPTGIVATSQDGRSQHDNKEKAMLVLRSRLFEKFRIDQESKLSNIRSSAIGNSERAEKIRTYNYPQNRVTDHRINLNLNKLNTVIDGDLEELCKNLIVFETEKKISTFYNDLLKEKN